MALNTLTPDALIARLSWRPPYIMNSMISIPEPIKSIALPRTLASSSIGPLDTLPTELLHIIFSSLDFQSLSRFTRVSHQAKITVESLPSYQRMMKHASTALIALSRTKLIKFHTAAAIYAALLADKCVSCQKYAAFLFLPTCERCCYECLHAERSLRVITIRMAGICFGISPKGLGQISIMLNIPVRYLVGHSVTRRKRVRLVSLKQAEELGISVHGSREAMERVGVLKHASNLSLRQLLLAQWLTGSRSADPPDDDFCGMASIIFPSLRPNGELENGLWCGGCRIHMENYHRTGELDSDTQLLFSGRHPSRLLSAMEHQARSKSEFLEHTRDCKGATDLLQHPERLLW